MKYRHTTWLVILFNLKAFGQINNLQFIEKRRAIDSVIAAIDRNKNIIAKPMVGNDSLFGDYKGIYYYSDSINKPDKIEFSFDSAEEGLKTFYYTDSLIKVIDNGSSLFSIDKLLLKDDGSAADSVKAGGLMGFEATFRKTFALLFRRE